MMNPNFDWLAPLEDLRRFSQKIAAEISVNKTEGTYFRSLIMGLLPASSKKILFSQTTLCTQGGNATYSVSVELSLIMDCLLDVQNTVALLTLTNIPVVERLVSLHSAQSASAKITSGEEQILLFG